MPPLYISTRLWVRIPPEAVHRKERANLAVVALCCLVLLCSLVDSCIYTLCLGQWLHPLPVVSWWSACCHGNHSSSSQGGEWVSLSLVTLLLSDPPFILLLSTPSLPPSLFLLSIIGKWERANLVVQLARFFCIYVCRRRYTYMYYNCFCIFLHDSKFMRMNALSHNAKLLNE